MGHQTGAGSILSMGLEDDLGTAAASGYLLPFISAPFGIDRTLNNSAVLDGNKNPGLPFLGNTMVSGNLVVPMDAEAFWFWLKAMFSTDTQAGVGDPYTHTFKSGEADQTPMTLEKKYTELTTSKYMRSVGCKIATWALDWGGGDSELVSTFGIVGKTETAEDSSHDAAPTTVAETTKFYATQAAITEAGSAAGELTGFSMNVDFKLNSNDYRINGAGQLSTISQSKMAITGNIQGVFEDTVIVDKALAGTESALGLTFINGTHSIAFAFDEVLFKPKTPALEGEQGIMINHDFIAYLDNDVDARAFGIVLTNATDRSGISAD